MIVTNSNNSNNSSYTITHPWNLGDSNRGRNDGVEFFLKGIKKVIKKVP